MSHQKKIKKFNITNIKAAAAISLVSALGLLLVSSLFCLKPAYGQPGNLSPQLAQLDSQLPEEIRVALKAAEDNLKLPEGKK
ncbi:MAG TPA: hypothetical protein DFI01_03325, partial [Bacteroidales bacterium]|nr:hypothetical protein [Bacteroidales bacterium]